MTKQRVAVVGSGVTGLGAAWLLSQHKNKFEVTLYEKNEDAGGHSHTVDYQPKLHTRTTPVDTGFIVFNQRTYPNLLQFFQHLGVAYEPSDMSFAVSRDQGAFEWAGQSLGTVFAQPRHLWSLSFWRMLLDIIRFNTMASQVLEEGSKDSKNDDDMTVGTYLNLHGYSDAFAHDYLVPMTAAIWSTPADTCWSQFPIKTLVQFMLNHGLLQILNHPQWFTVTKGSRSYVGKVVAGVENVRLASPVVRLRRLQQGQDCQGVEVECADGSVDRFDYVIVAAHADEAFRMLEVPTDDEKSVLSPIQFVRNRVVLHSDARLMPRIRKTWSSWNYLTSSRQDDSVCLTYWMNRLQTIDSSVYGDIFVTMNPLVEPLAECVQAEYYYTHPLYNQQLINVQPRLAELNQKAVVQSRTLFCGAWSNYGFHEDGLTAGLKSAALLGATCPFPIIDVHDWIEEQEHVRYERYALSARVSDVISFIGWLLMYALDMFFMQRARHQTPIDSVSKKK